MKFPCNHKENSYRIYTKGDKKKGVQTVHYQKKPTNTKENSDAENEGGAIRHI
jgi:beta-glucanase (GH16 family)